MKLRLKRKNKIIALISVLLFFLPIQVLSAQTEQDAQQAVQLANEKLIEVIDLLEEISTKNIDVSDLVTEADDARQLIWNAQRKITQDNYSGALQNANEAIEQLDELILQIKELMDLKQRNSRLIFSFLGFVLAIFVVFTVFIFFKRILPWYKTKQLEEYGKLEIIYEESIEEG
jgi:nitrate/nitrite-specific signal transduction histidine kinase